MKQFLLSLLVASALGTTATAQHIDIADKVEAGTKGSLPTLANVPQGDGSTMPLMSLERIYTYMSTQSGDTSHSYNADFVFHSPSFIGAEYFILQVMANGQWQDYKTAKADSVKIENTHHSITLSADYSQYRVRVVGGASDGKVSNVIEAICPTIPTTYGWSYSEDDIIVGTTLEAASIADVTAYTKNGSNVISDPKSFLLYNWYRCNPNDNSLTPIEGAHTSQYKTTTADAGYYIISEIKGDGRVLDLTFRKTTRDIVRFPVYCSTEYVGKDGMIFLSEYDLDVANLQVCRENYENGTYEPLQMGTFTKVQPGKYIYRANLSDYQDDMLFVRYMANKSIGLFYTYGHDMAESEEGFQMTREATLTLFGYEWQFTATMNGALANAEIEILKRNIDGELEVDQVLEIHSDSTYAYLMQGEYYLRTKASASTIATYYPATTRWEEATLLHIPDYENYTPVYNIEMQPASAPLSAQGFVEGTFNAVCGTRLVAHDNCIETLMANVPHVASRPALADALRITK